MNYPDMDFVQLVRKKTSEEFEFEVPRKREYYSHPTFVVNSLSEYIKLVTIISKVPIIDDDPLYHFMTNIENALKKRENGGQLRRLSRKLGNRNTVQQS